MPLRTDRRSLRAAALALAAWLAFGLLQVVLARSVATMAAPWGTLLRFYAALAVLWFVLSALIAPWDRVARARWPGAVSRFVAHIPAALLAALADATIRRAMIRAEGGLPSVPFTATLLYYADLVAVSYVAVVLVADALDKSRALAEHRRIGDRLAAQLASARLEYLDAQLQPHFLFNSLGAVSELAHEAPLTAARVLRQLASLLRSAFSTETDQVTLGHELVSLEPYLEIQRIRYSDWLDIVHDIDDRAADCLVPRLMLQPLVENAVRHGVAGRVAPGCIALQAHIADGRLVVRVRDNGVGLSSRGSNGGHGIGLSNLRERLATLYPGDAHLRLYRDDAGTIAELSLPVVHAPAEQVAAVAPPSGAAPIAPPSPPREYSVVGIVAVWAICGLLWTQQSLAYLALRGRLAGTSWLSIVRSDSTTALVWALLTLVIFAAAERFPITAAGWRVRGSLYLLAGVIVSASHVLITRALGDSPLALVSQAYASMFTLNLVIYAAILAVGHRRRIAHWMFERETAAARLAAELNEARARAAHLRADPQFLLSTLERLAGSVAADPHGTERRLARLADYLRISLDTATRDSASRAAALAALDAEMAIHAAPMSGKGAA